MLRVGKLADYAVVILHFLGKRPGEQFTMDTIAKHTFLPKATVRKLLRTLTQSALVVSRRGARGGYQIARAPQEISVAAAIAAVEGPLMLTECCSSPCDCGIAPSCDLNGSWLSINHIVIEALNKVSVADLSHAEESGDRVQYVSVGL